MDDNLEFFSDDQLWSDILFNKTEDSVERNDY